MRSSSGLRWVWLLCFSLPHYLKKNVVRFILSFPNSYVNKRFKKSLKKHVLELNCNWLNDIERQTHTKKNNFWKRNIHCQMKLNISAKRPNYAKFHKMYKFIEGICYILPLFTFVIFMFLLYIFVIYTLFTFVIFCPCY